LAAGWTFALHAAAATGLTGRLVIRYNTKVTAINPIRGTPDFNVTLDPPAANTPPTFRFILWATGFGKEMCEIPTGAPTPYRGHPFWDTDKFEAPNCGLSPSPRVLITGSGDGALQDFLRVATKLKSAEEIYKKAGIPPDVATRLTEYEDRARRIPPVPSFRRED
jgi:hypothetical protein